MPATDDTSPQNSASNQEASSEPQISGAMTTTPADNDGSSPRVTTQSADSGQRQRPQRQLWGTLMSCVTNMMMVYMLTKYFFPNQRATQGPGAENALKAKPAHNLFGRGFSMDMYVYVSEDSFEPDFFNPQELRWIQKGIFYDEWDQGPSGDSTFQTEFDIKLSPKVQRNGSLWLHTYFVKTGLIPYEESRTAENFSPIYTLHKKKQLNRYKKRRYRDTHNLITGKTEKSAEEQEKIKRKIKEEVISHWHPNLTINMVYDHTPWTPGSVPAPLDEFIDFEPTSGRYYPIVYLNDYWNLLRDYQPINETVDTVHLALTYQPLSMIKWQLYAAQGMRSKWYNVLGAEAIENEEDQDYIKEALLETSPILLGMTVVVSIAHTIFEFLAFKNDIQFWKDRKSLEGLSVRSVFFNLFQSMVVLLYVLDNETNYLIRFSIGIGLLIELWKIPKVTNIKIDRDNKVLGIFPRVKFEDKGSYVESSTKEYDMMAYKYLSWLIGPLFFGYAIYSLIYNEHKGWYSFILTMTYGFLLAFGFIMMTPQLFINYKLKSVAHLPWRMLSYKFLNTFIDDIFAFVIKMPLMYRLGCFRDDIIFIIYVYQRWIYRVDPSRVNEFGVSGEDLEQASNAATDAASQPSVQGSVSSSSDGTGRKHSERAKKSASEKKND